jgi:Fe-S cluster assembly protein SufD
LNLTASPALRQPLDPDVVERSAVERGEPDWLITTRLAAAKRVAEWPTGQEEEWRRFPPREIPASPLLGGRADTTYDAPPRAYVADLSVAARERPAVLGAWIGAGGTVKTHEAFTAVADALWSAGTFVHVPRGVTLDRPVVVEHRWRAGEEACLSRTIIVAEEDTTVTVLEDTDSEPGGERIAIPHLEVHVGRGAQVRYVHIQRFSRGVWDIGAQWYGSSAQSRLESYNVLLGSTRTKLGLVSDILGDRAEVKLHGVIAAADEQKIDVNSFQRLDGRGSQSDLLYLSALYEAAKATFYGLVRVEKTSHATGSYQECRNLLLSDKAGAHPIPVLEILTNDVARCGHGATAGRLDEDEVFYLMSRGIGRHDAEQVLVRGSFSRVVDRIPEANVRARVLEALVPRIGRVPELEVAA